MPQTPVRIAAFEELKKKEKEEREKEENEEKKKNGGPNKDKGKTPASLSLVEFIHAFFALPRRIRGCRRSRAVRRLFATQYRIWGRSKVWRRGWQRWPRRAVV